MDILDDMGVSKLSAKAFLKVNSFKSMTKTSRHITVISGNVLNWQKKQ